MKRFTEYRLIVEIYNAYEQYINAIYRYDIVDTTIGRVEHNNRQLTFYHHTLIDIMDEYDLNEDQFTKYKNTAEQIWHELNTL